MRLILSMLAVMFVASTSCAYAFDQVDPYFESVGSDESIPDNNVTALTQDATGFLWIGTPDGLIRYDGYRFRHFDHESADSTSPGGDFVRSMLTARDGQLWVGSNADGVSAIDPISGRIERFRAGDGDRALSNNSVRALAEDRDGSVWIGTREGVDQWDPATGQMRHYRQRFGASTSIDDEQIIALMVDSAGDVWIGSWGGLGVRRHASGAFERITASTAGGRTLVGEQVQSLLQLDNGQIMVGTGRGGSYVLNPDGSLLRGVPIEVADLPGVTQPAVLSLLQPRAGVLWIAAFGGIDVIDTNNFSLLRQIRPDPAVASSLAHDQVRAMLRDRSGQIWIGGYGGGLQRHDPTNDSIRILRHSPTRPGALSSPSVSSVLELGNGQVWVGTRGNGIDVLDRNRGVIDGYRPEPSNPRGLSSGVISSLAQTADGAVWVGTLDGLHRFDPARGDFERLGPERGVPDVYVRRLLAGDGDLWVGTDAGLARVNLADSSIDRLPAQDGSVLRIDINALALAADGRLWVGGSAGLFTIAPGHRSLQRVSLRSTDAAEPIQVGIVGLLLDATGQLWADTPIGLHRLSDFDGKSTLFSSVSARLGAVGVPFGANLLQDREGRIWSQRFVYDPRGDSLYELGRADGADLGTPWFRAYAATRDGRLLFGGSKGLMVVDPTRFHRWEFKPPLAVTELKVGGALQPLINAADGFSVSPQQRRFSVEFAALDFTAPQRNRYQYRLDGFDTEWIDSDPGRRIAAYNSLNPGSYVLRIRGSGRAGELSASELAIPVSVIAAFWQTWWFRLLALGVFALALIIGVRLHNLRIRRRAQQLEHLVNRRTAELTQSKESAEDALQQLQNAQEELVAREKMASLGQLVAGVAHEINTPVGVALTASSYLSERSDALRAAFAAGSLQRSELAAFIAQAHEASTMIGQNLTRASDLVRSFKQVSVDRSSDDRRRFNLHDSLRAVVSSLELTWKRRPIQLELDCAASIELDSYPGALGQVITNLIQNALLHAFDGVRGGTMRLSAVPIGGDRVRISFEDDGNGIGAAELARVFEPFFTTRRAQGGSGLGLHIVFNLVTAQLGGRIEASGQPGAGMRFVLTVPLKAPQ
ncbi:MAG TPA: two-component regulator propeller domain-containing protein [Xanthomonadales bacterium]|nr:two-component regulator propeller domain-containing protein [Xanthomonadales bacterium]